MNIFNIKQLALISSYLNNYKTIILLNTFKAQHANIQKQIKILDTLFTS